MSLKDFLIVIFCVLVLSCVIYLASQSSVSNSPISATSTINNNQNNHMALNLTSSAFSNNSNIPSKYSCQGESINPPLTIEGTDSNALSLTLIMEDPDTVPLVGYVYDHWVKFNIDPKTMQIEEGKEPAGTAGKNSNNGLTYIGPCPPNGLHHYYFRLYSLDTKLTLPEGASKRDVEAAMQGHILQQAELIGLYTKVK